MDADARALARGEEARHAFVLIVENHFGVVIGWNPAHGVVRGGMRRNQIALGLQTLIHAHEVGDVGDLLVEHLATQVTQVQVDVVLAADAPAFLDLLEHAARHDVARRQVLQRRRVAFHEALTGIIQQDAAFTARRLGNQDAQAVNAGRMELEELHILQRNAAPRGHDHAVTGERERVRSDLEDATEPAGAKEHGFGVEHVDLGVQQVQRHHTAALAVGVDQQVDHHVLVVELDLVLDPLLVEGLEDHVTGAIGGIARAHHRRGAVILGVATEATLRDLAFGRA